MKDQYDKRTDNPLRSGNLSAARQRRYKQHQRERGRRQFTFWATEAEKDAIGNLLRDLRESKGITQQEQ